MRVLPYISQKIRLIDVVDTQNETWMDSEKTGPNEQGTYGHN